MKHQNWPLLLYWIICLKQMLCKNTASPNFFFFGLNLIENNLVFHEPVGSLNSQIQLRMRLNTGFFFLLKTENKKLKIINKKFGYCSLFKLLFIYLNALFYVSWIVQEALVQKKKKNAETQMQCFSCTQTEKWSNSN